MLSCLFPFFCNCCMPRLVLLCSCGCCGCCAAAIAIASVSVHQRKRLEPDTERPKWSSLHSVNRLFFTFSFYTEKIRLSKQSRVSFFLKYRGTISVSEWNIALSHAWYCFGNEKTWPLKLEQVDKKHNGINFKQILDVPLGQTNPNRFVRLSKSSK